MDTYVTWSELFQAAGLVIDIIGIFLLILQIKKK